MTFQQGHGIRTEHLELHAMPCCNIERKNLRVDLRRTDTFMPHQALQYLQRNTGVQHVHGIAVAERVRRHRHGERHPIGRSGIHGFIDPRPGRAVGDFPDAGLFRPAGAFVPALQRNFQRGHHHLQLADVLRI